MHAYVTSDFSVVNVVENSHTDKPLLYQITGVWGNHEGSMLLWVFMLGVCGAALALFSGNLPPDLRARVLAVQGMIATGFLLFILLTSNPFLRTWPPAANGHGLNPGAAGPWPRVPSAVPLSRLCRLLGRLRVRGRRADRRPRGCRLGALGAAVDARLLVRPDHRHRDGKLVGLLHAGLGRLVVLGPGGERLVHAVAGRHRADPLVDRGGEARHAEELDHPAGDHHVLPVAGRHLPGALRRADVGARVRHRSGRAAPSSCCCWWSRSAAR